MSFKPVCMIGDLSGPEGNVFVVIGRVAQCLREFAPDGEAAFRAQAKAGTYADALRAVRAFVDPIYTGMDDEEYFAVNDEEARDE